MLLLIIITEPFIINNNNGLRNFVPLVNTASFSLVKNIVSLVTKKEMEQQKRRNIMLIVHDNKYQKHDKIDRNLCSVDLTHSNNFERLTYWGTKSSFTLLVCSCL